MGDSMDTEAPSQTTQTDQTSVGDGTGQTGLTTAGGTGQTAVEGGAGQTLMEGYHGDNDSSSEDAGPWMELYYGWSYIIYGQIGVTS